MKCSFFCWKSLLGTRRFVLMFRQGESNNVFSPKKLERVDGEARKLLVLKAGSLRIKTMPYYFKILRLWNLMPSRKLKDLWFNLFFDQTQQSTSKGDS